jgi:ABC-type Fe3+-siderophore transport system permease subunit
MVINRTALVIGAILGLLIAVLVGMWEKKMAKKKKNGIVTLSIFGGIAFIIILFAVIGEIAPYSDVSDILRNVIIAALLTFVPLRRLTSWIDMIASGNKASIDDEHKDN